MCRVTISLLNKEKLHRPIVKRTKIVKNPNLKQNTPRSQADASNARLHFLAIAHQHKRALPLPLGHTSQSATALDGIGRARLRPLRL